MVCCKMSMINIMYLVKVVHIFYMWWEQTSRNNRFLYKILFPHRIVWSMVSGTNPQIKNQMTEISWNNSFRNFSRWVGGQYSLQNSFLFLKARKWCSDGGGGYEGGRWGGGSTNFSIFPRPRCLATPPIVSVWDIVSTKNDKCDYTHHFSQGNIF